PRRLRGLDGQRRGAEPGGSGGVAGAAPGSGGARGAGRGLRSALPGATQPEERRPKPPRAARVPVCGGVQTPLSESFTAKPRKRAPAAEVTVARRRRRRVKAAARRVPVKMRTLR